MAMIDKHNPWIDPRVHDIRVASVKSYMLRHGWVIKPFPRPQVLLFELPGENGGPPIRQVFCSSERIIDYPLRAEELVLTLCRLEDRHPVKVLEDLLREPPYVEPLNGAAANGAAHKSADATSAT